MLETCTRGDLDPLPPNTTYILAFTWAGGELLFRQTSTRSSELVEAVCDGWSQRASGSAHRSAAVVWVNGEGCRGDNKHVDGTERLPCEKQQKGPGPTMGRGHCREEGWDGVSGSH